MGSTSISYQRNSPITWLKAIRNQPALLKPYVFVLALVLVVGIAGGLRWRAVNMLPVDYDEDDYLRAAQEYTALMRAGDWKGFTETNYRPEHPPLAKILFGLSVLPLPERPLIQDRPTSAQPNQYLPKDLLRNARDTSALFGTLETLLVAIVSPVAGLFLAVHTFTIKYTSQVMLEAFPAFTSMASVSCYLLYKRKLRSQPKSGSFNRWLIFSAILLGWTAASKYLYAIVGIAILIDWLLTGRERIGLKQTTRMVILWGVISVLVFFISDPYLWSSPVERLKESVFYHTAYSQGAVEVQQTNWPIWQPLIWLAQSCPWHPGVFIISVDLLISLLEIVGFSRLWEKERIYCLWLGVAIIFLLIWPTKWPQYILVLTAPLSIAAGEGIKALTLDPVRSLWKKLNKRTTRPALSFREIIASVPWLLPGMITLGVLIAFPLFYQLAMSLTDFSGPSIMDGIKGGIWREVWGGLTGQIKAINWDPFAYTTTFSKTVRYSGFEWLKNLLTGTPELIVFELLWTVLSVSLQAILGIGVALLINQRGIRFPNVWRTIFLLPWAIPEFVGALVWLRTFDPTVGWVPQAFGTSGGGGGAILVSKIINAGGPNLALLLLLVAATWIGFPFVMLAASASLKLIPDEVYDAAAIDGASKWPLFKHVTWPLLLPLLVPVLIIRAIFAFNQFYLFYVFFPTPRLNLFGTFSYFSYIVFKEQALYSFSAAINIVTVVILIIVLILFNRWSKASEGVTYA